MADDIAAMLDLRGLKCPYPVIKTENRLAKMAAGSLISVDTTDPLSAIDIPHFCSENAHVLVSQEKLENGHRFVIRKKLD
jgi:tRNA 2-thiouridine synthesizing protein A